jgi:hypothetical protein
MMRTVNRWSSALALVALAACGGGQKNDDTTTTRAGAGATGAAGAMPGDTAPLPAVPDQPVPEPSSVLAVFSLGDPAGQFGQIGKFADAVQPGAGAMATPANLMPPLAAAVGAPGLDGYATDRPLWVVGLDPSVAGASVVLVVAVGDEARLKGSVGGSAELLVHGAYAAIGTRAALRAVGPWALSSLVTKAPPPELSVVVHLARFMKGQGARQMEAAMRSGAASGGRREGRQAVEGMISVLHQVDRLEGSIVADASGLTVNGWVVPIAQSGLAAFAAAQQPTDYGFVARLPGDWPSMLYAGRLDLGPFKSFFVQFAAGQGGAAAQIAQIFDLLGTEQAVGVAIRDGSPRMAAMIALTDGKQAAGLVDAAAKILAKAGPLALDSMAATVKPGALKVAGGALHEISFAPAPQATAEEKQAYAKMWPKGMKVHAGVVGGALIAAIDRDPAAVKALAKNTGPKPPKPKYGKHVSSAIAVSTDRRESALVLVDVAMWGLIHKSADPTAAAPKSDRPPVAVGLGFDGGRVSGRIYLPVEQLKGMMQRAM